MLDWIAGAVSAAGLVGIYNKRPWGPLACGCASAAWSGIAFSEGRTPWALVECCWCVAGFATYFKWVKE